MACTLICMLGQDIKSVEELSHEKSFDKKSNRERLHFFLELLLALITVTVSIWAGIIFRKKMQDDSQLELTTAENQDNDTEEDSTNLLQKEN